MREQMTEQLTIHPHSSIYSQFLFDSQDSRADNRQGRQNRQTESNPSARRRCLRFKLLVHVPSALSSVVPPYSH